LPEASRDTIIKNENIDRGWLPQKPKKETGAASAKGQKLPYGMSLPEVKLLVCIVTASPVVTSEAQVFANYWLIKYLQESLYFLGPWYVCVLSSFDHLFCFLIQ